MGEVTETDVDDYDTGVDSAAGAVARARSFLKDFEEADTEVRYGAIKHAIDELENARRELPDDY